LPPLLGSSFCKKHQKCTVGSPVTGCEPAYNPSKYNKKRSIRESHNCFAYAFDYIDLPDKSKCDENSCDVPFHQPGYASGYPKWGEIRTKRCPELIARLRGDIPGLITPIHFHDKCPRNTSKVAVIKTRKNTDYHFVRQDNNGYWSHKPGGTEVTRLDASDRPIFRPDLADWDYRKKGSDLNYENFCAYMCVPKKKKLTFKRGGRSRRTRRSRTRRSRSQKTTI
jgi:hypothetical protein